MPVTHTGEMTYPYTNSIGGQKVRFYENHLVFIMENKLYQTAGYQSSKEITGRSDWHKKVENGSMTSQGIGLNKKLYKKMMKTDKDFIVYNKKTHEFYQLQNKQLVPQHLFQEQKGLKTIIVTPLDAYQKIETGIAKNTMDQKIQELSA